MQIALQTLIAIITLTAAVFAKSISTTAHTTSTTTTMPPSEDYISDELEKLKQLLRNRAPSLNSLSQLNITVEAKRKLLRQYREKLQQLNQLHKDRPEEIHQRDVYSYPAITDDYPKDGVYRFPVTIPHPDDHTRETKVEKATLTLHRRDNLTHIDSVNDDQRNVGHTTVLMVYQTLPGHMRRLVTSFVISLARTEDINIDITEIAQNWIDEPALNLGVEIECTTHNISQIILPIDLEHTDRTKPTLDISAYEKTINTARRQRRDVEEDACQPGKCCRRPVTISLRDIGHHIEGLHEEDANMTAYLCSGRCPRNYKLHNKWSDLKNIIRLKDRSTELRNRCAPTTYEKETFLLHFDFENGAIAYREYDDVIVKECGCV